MKNARFVVRYTDTRTDTTVTINSALTNLPFKKQATAETTARQIRGNHYAANVRVEPSA